MQIIIIKQKDGGSNVYMSGNLRISASETVDKDTIKLNIHYDLLKMTTNLYI